MPNGRIKQDYVQGFILKLLILKNLLPCLNAWKLRKLLMKVLYNPLIKTIIVDANCVVQSRQKRGGAASSKSYSQMGNWAGNQNQR